MGTLSGSVKYAQVVKLPIFDWNCCYVGNGWNRSIKCQW